MSAGMVTHLGQAVQSAISRWRAARSAGMVEVENRSNTSTMRIAHLDRFLESTTTHSPLTGGGCGINSGFVSGKVRPALGERVRYFRRRFSALRSARSNATNTIMWSACSSELIGAAPLVASDRFTALRIRRNRFGLSVTKNAVASTRKAPGVKGGGCDIGVSCPRFGELVRRTRRIWKIFFRTAVWQDGTIRSLADACARAFHKLLIHIHSRAFSPSGARTGVSGAPRSPARPLILSGSGDQGRLHPAPLSHQRVKSALCVFPSHPLQQVARRRVRTLGRYNLSLRGSEVVLPVSPLSSLHLSASVRPVLTPSR